MKAVSDLPELLAARCPGAVAMEHKGRTTTYAELNAHSAQIANGLIATGRRAGSRVAYLGKNSDVYFELLLGSARANWVIVPINWRLSPSEVEFIIADAAAEVVVVEREFLNRVELLLAETAKQVLVIEGEDARDFRAWRERQSPSDPDLSHQSDATVIMMYTSGTTGVPKGVELTNRNILGHLRFIANGAFGEWTADDVQLICLPISHIGGTDCGLWGIYAGARNLILATASAEEIVGAFAQRSITITGLVPAIVNLVLDHPEVARADFSHLKLISYGGSPISAELLVRATEVFDCRFQQLFGLTETTGGVVKLAHEDHVDGNPKRLRSCGRPLPDVEVRVVDETGTPRPVGETGEIAIRAEVVMKGYWNRPAETREAIRDGWFFTGDAGYFDADGYLYIHDRIKDKIVSGGENIYPAEVEAALAAHAAVAETAVIGVPDPKWGEAVKAFVVLRPGHSPSAAELIAFARTRIAAFKCPKSIEFVHAVPRNASGKILRRELRQPYWQGQARQVG